MFRNSFWFHFKFFLHENMVFSENSRFFLISLLFCQAWPYPCFKSLLGENLRLLSWLATSNLTQLPRVWSLGVCPLSVCAGSLPACVGFLHMHAGSLPTCVGSLMGPNPLGWLTQKKKYTNVLECQGLWLDFPIVKNMRRNLHKHAFFFINIELDHVFLY